MLSLVDVLWCDRALVPDRPPEHPADPPFPGRFVDSVAVAFGALLRRHRLAAGLTQEALAERAGVSAKAVSELERDPARRPRLASVGLLADALGLTPDERAALLAEAQPPGSDAPPGRGPCRRVGPCRGR